MLFFWQNKFYKARSRGKTTIRKTISDHSDGIRNLVDVDFGEE